MHLALARRGRIIWSQRVDQETGEPMDISLGALTEWRWHVVVPGMVLFGAIVFGAAIRVVEVTVTSPSGQKTHGSFSIWPWNSAEAAIQRFATQASPAFDGRKESYEVRAFFGLVVVEHGISKFIVIDNAADGRER